MDLITSLVVGLLFALVTLLFIFLDYCCKEEDSSNNDCGDGFEGSQGYETYPMILRRPIITNSNSEQKENEEQNENEDSSECGAKAFEIKVDVHQV